MSNHCQKPDRDVPKLVCGYPLPCPHHTYVIDGRELDEGEQALQNALANLRWFKGRVHINTYFTIQHVDEHGASFKQSRVKIRVTGVWTRAREFIEDNKAVHYFKETLLPITASITEIRNATEELQLEARAWLEERYATPVPHVTKLELLALRQDVHPRAGELPTDPLPPPKPARQRRGGTKGQRYRNRR